MKTKKLINLMHGAAHRAKDRILSLENELAKRDIADRRGLTDSFLTKSIVEQQRAGLVDIYSEQQVTKELRNRLTNVHYGAASAAGQHKPKRVRVPPTRSKESPKVKTGAVEMRRSYSPVSNVSSEAIVDPDELSRLIDGKDSMPRNSRVRSAVIPSDHSDDESQHSLMLYDEDETRFNGKNEPLTRGNGAETLQFPSRSPDSRWSADGGDPSRQMGMLLAQLDLARSENRELLKRFDDSERLLERMRLDAESRDAEMEALVAGKAADMVDSISSSQRERDLAMMSRVRLANKERDDAISRASRLQAGGDDYTRQSSSPAAAAVPPYNSLPAEQSMEQMLRRLESADNQADMPRSPAVSDDAYTALVFERDAALLRSKRLQRELEALHEEPSSALRDRLAASDQERDEALARVRRLEDEMQTLRVYYSLHKSLAAASADESNEDDPSASLTKEQLQAQLKEALADRFQLTNELHTAHQLCVEADAKAAKFERLAKVLRKKLATGAVAKPTGPP